MSSAPRAAGLARRLASAVRRKDQHPNIELAIELAEARDAESVTELFRLMDSGPKKQTLRSRPGGA